MKTDEDQLKWAESDGFHRQLIPFAVIGAVVGPFVVMSIIAHFTDSDRLLPSLIDLILGVPIGLVGGYIVGQAAMQGILQRIRWARDHGWTYESNGKAALQSKVKNAKELKHATTYWKMATKNCHMTRTVNGRGACIMLASEGDDSSNQTRKHRSFLVFDAGTECGHIVIHPHHMTDAIDLPGGMQPITFELNEFNKQWTVKGTDPKSAYDRISQKTIDYLMQHGTNYSVEFKGGLVIVSSNAADYRSFPSLMGYATGLTRVIEDDLLPLFDFLEREHAADASKAPDHSHSS